MRVSASSKKELPFKPERKHIIGHDGIGPIVLALAIGTVGGFVFNWLRMPLAWMLGSCLFTTIAAFAGLRVGMRVRLRQGMIIILGVLLGSGFNPDLVQRLGQWAVSLGVVSLMTVTAATACYFWLRRTTDWNRQTCYFAAMPGGLNDMTILGGAMGGEERCIALAQALRILTVVMTIPIWYRLVNGAQTSVLTIIHGPSGNDWKDYAVLIGCGVVGATAGRLLRLPAAFMMGPMIISAAAHLGGLSDSKPPGELVAAAQVVVGAGIGCRFVGAVFDKLHKEIAASIGAALIMIAIAVLFAKLTVALTGLNLDATVLSYAPGGFAEMSLIGLALGVEIAMVATHHLFRLFLILMTSPLIFRMWLRREREGPEAPS
ncbi:AbrB family transcriptional regulator [Reyranella sp.]|uniref:AbrB family transcriptional regulator n=1 Tax=Reyranella sp. TaxID=1929291 RepID=UPI003D1210B6